MELKFYNDSLHDYVEKYTLSKEQLKFVRSPGNNIEIAKYNKQRYPVLGFDNEKCVSFFVLDMESEFKEQFEVIDAVYLRSFSTDYRYLRRGYARQMLTCAPKFIHEHFPDIKYIALLVDDPNIHAQTLYQKAGFTIGKQIKGERYDGHLMYYEIVKGL
ncbi:GNAT family N-acetyltransferase [Macrococcoides canis]|uniref:GNAT family N-acetyltransferase n=1 Tax=Macrococcoides canis TaxID=1855823 RepID=UPI0020B7B036|nr:GNAT family N-acetyltransferase [Macrococcus canis]UTH02542.1 GNAT family N-acetyltransferase [Macrococcus canis]